MPTGQTLPMAAVPCPFPRSSTPHAHTGGKTFPRARPKGPVPLKEQGLFVSPPLGNNSPDCQAKLSPPPSPVPSRSVSVMNRRKLWNNTNKYNML